MCLIFEMSRTTRVKALTLGLFMYLTGYELNNQDKCSEIEEKGYTY
jgi:hypothetical protein